MKLSSGNDELNKETLVRNTGSDSSLEWTQYKQTKQILLLQKPPNPITWLVQQSPTTISQI